MTDGKNITQGNLMRHIFALSIPSMLGMVFEVLYEIIDMAWVARLSINAVAAITIFTTIFLMLDMVNGIIGTSSVTLIARYFGSGDKEKTVEVIEQTIIFKFMLAMLIGILTALIIPYALRPLANNDEILSMSIIYGRIRLITLPLAFSSYTVNTALRCIGDAKKPLYLMAFSAILNSVLDPIMIFDVIPFIGIPGLGLGIAGAAYATVISQLVSFMLGLYILMSGKTFIKISFKRGLYFVKDIDLKLITIGLPTGIESLFRNLASFVIIKYLTIYGVMVVAAYGICNRIVSLVIMPIFGLEMGTGVIVGQCLGCSKKDRAEKAVYLATKISFFIMLTAGLIMFILPEYIMKIFTEKQAIIDIGIVFLRYFAFASLFAGPASSLGAALFGAGDNMPAMICGLAAVWAVQIPLMHIFIKILMLPVDWVWFTYIVMYAFQFAFILYFVKKGQWKHKSF